MKDGQQTISRKTRRDIRTLRIMTAIYCQDHHGQANDGAPQRRFRRLNSAVLCPDCENLMAYAIERLCRCPLDPKPSCRDCHIHCYAPEQRDKVRRIMRHSWPSIIKRGRIDLLWKLLVTDRKKNREKDR